jgi:predicted phosphodiesterase
MDTENAAAAEIAAMPYDPGVFVVGHDYQIIFFTDVAGIGWVEIGGVRYTDEEAGVLRYGNVHKIPVPGEALDRARRYTVVFVEYAEKPPYYPKGVERVRREYVFTPLEGDTYRIFQFADTHARTEGPLALYRETGECDLIVLNGDINDSSRTTDHFRTAFVLAAGAARGERPIVYSRGNHDTRGHAAQQLLDYIPPACRDGRRETFYSFRQGSLWGLVLDCGEDKDDGSVEYGGTVFFSEHRRRETAYLHSLIESKEEEYAAPGIRTRLAVCHIPIVERYKGQFDIENDVYDEWTRLLSEMGIDLLLCGHMHRAYILPPHAEGKRDAACPTAVCSIPSVKREDGTEYYVGGLIEVAGDRRTVKCIPDGEAAEF